MKVINMFAGPGAGKSTTAAGLFYKMKLNGYKCELITEYAKELVYENRMRTLENQIYVFGKQIQRMHRVDGQVDFVITDSPIILSSIYAPVDYPSSFHDLVLDMWTRWDNHCFFIDRVKAYQQYGRTQTLDQARQIDTKVKQFLDSKNIPYQAVAGTPTAPSEIMTALSLNNES